MNNLEVVEEVACSTDKKLVKKQLVFLVTLMLLLFICLCLIGVIGSTFKQRALQNELKKTASLQKAIEIAANESQLLLTPSPMKEAAARSTLWLKNDLVTRDNRGIVLTDVPPVDIVIEFSEDISVDPAKTREQQEVPNEKLVTNGIHTFLVHTNLNPGGGGCPEIEDKNNPCGYDDEAVGNLVLRIWHDEIRGVFRITFDHFSVDDYFTDTVGILKTAPSSSFTQEDIAFWRYWLLQAKTIPAQSN